MAQQSYGDKLKDPRWQRKRLEILERDDWKCTICGSGTSSLHVHHGYYEKYADPWAYDSNTLHTVCEHCHHIADGMRIVMQKAVASVPVLAHADLLKFVLLLHGGDWLWAVELCEMAVDRCDPRKGVV